MLINGRKMDIEAVITIIELLKILNLDSDRVVVEVNSEIIEKEKYSDFILNHEDRVEIVSFVGGG